MNHNNITFEHASKLLDKKRYKESLEIFLKLQEREPVYALNIGYIYEKLLNKKEAKLWYTIGINSDFDSACMENLAIIYKEEYNFNKAKKWFLSSIKCGNDDAALELAKILLQEAQILKAKMYLEIVVNSENVCESSKEDAHKLLARINKYILNKRQK